MEITSFDKFKKRARPKCRVSLVGQVKTDTETPVSLFARYQREKYAFLLESVEGGERWGRYSFIGLYPELIFKSCGKQVEIIEGKKRRRYTADQPLEELRKIHQRLPFVAMPGLPRFPGGAVGYVGYDQVRFFEKKIPTQAKEDLKLPDLYFVFPKIILVLDSVAHSLQVLYNATIESPKDVKKEYEKGRRLILTVAQALKRRPKPSSPKKKPGKITWTTNQGQKAFEAGVKKIREYIFAGDVTQTVLSVRFEANISLEAFSLYRALRTVNPSPYLFYLQLDDLKIVGASPETMVRLEGREMVLRPIAGTRRRGKDDAEDTQLEQELLADPKERAEHIMLVDLGRNDLGRVAEKGTVTVDQLMIIERYSHVMHIVSNVKAQLAAGKDAFDLLRATFPAGTLSGSPKVRAMQIIEELEPTRRGIYGGCIGYFAYSGNMDMAITIRSAVIQKGKIYLQAGAGIVADSVPDKEYEECCNKAKGMMKAVEHAFNDR